MRMLSSYIKCMLLLKPIRLRTRQISQYASAASQELSAPKAVSTTPPKGLNFYISTLQTCASVDQLHKLHAEILKTHFSRNVFLLTRLAHAYLKFGCLNIGKDLLSASSRTHLCFFGMRGSNVMQGKVVTESQSIFITRWFEVDTNRTPSRLHLCCPLALG